MTTSTPTIETYGTDEPPVPESIAIDPLYLKAALIDLVHDYGDDIDPGTIGTPTVEIISRFSEETMLVRLIQNRLTGQIVLIRDDTDAEERRPWILADYDGLKLPSGQPLEDEDSLQLLRGTIDDIEEELMGQVVARANSPDLLAAISEQELTDTQRRIASLMAQLKELRAYKIRLMQGETSPTRYRLTIANGDAAPEQITIETDSLDGAIAKIAKDHLYRLQTSGITISVISGNVDTPIPHENWYGLFKATVGASSERTRIRGLLEDRAVASQ